MGAEPGRGEGSCSPDPRGKAASPCPTHEPPGGHRWLLSCLGELPGSAGRVQGQGKHMVLPAPSLSFPVWDAFLKDEAYLAPWVQWCLTGAEISPAASPKGLLQPADTSKPTPHFLVAQMSYCCPEVSYLP